MGFVLQSVQTGYKVAQIDKFTGVYRHCLLMGSLVVMLLMTPTLALICFFACELKPISEAPVDPSLFFLLLYLFPS